MKGRLRRLVVPLVGAITTLSVLNPPAHADDTVDPTGIGDLMPGPGKLPPEGKGTLYEEYNNTSLWILDDDLGNFDFEGTVAFVANILMALIVVVGRAVTVIVGWLYNLVSLPDLSNAVEGAISGASGWMLATFFPAAFAIGAVSAFSQRREAQGSEMGQFAWLFVSAILGVSLLTSPDVWVSGVDTTRQLGASVASKVAADGMSTEDDYPFKLDHEPDFSGDSDTDAMLRKSSDSVWRAYVAGPWCVANFGSIEVCKRHGKDLLDQGTDRGARKEWLRENVNNKGEGSDGHVGEESVKWRQGKYTTDRIGITAIALLALVIFAALVILLALSALFAMIGALMLLVMGVVFASLWCIPGRPREWGKKWFDFLLGFTLQSFIATMILGVVLIMNSVITGMMTEYGWLIASGLSIAVAVAAFKLRRLMESIVGVSGVLGGGAALGGYLAMRGAGAVAGRAARVARNAGKMLPKPPHHGGGAPGGASSAEGGGGLQKPPWRPSPPPPPQTPTGSEPATPPGPGSTSASKDLPKPPPERVHLSRAPSRPDLPPGEIAGGPRSIPATPVGPAQGVRPAELEPPRRGGASPRPPELPHQPTRGGDAGRFRPPVPPPGQESPRTIRGQVLSRRTVTDERRRPTAVRQHARRVPYPRAPHPTRSRRHD